MFEEKTINKNGVYKKVLAEIPSEIPMSKKMEMRKRINEEVFDIHDSVADLTKWLSYVTSMLRRVWEIIPEEQKQTLSEIDRQFIEGSMAKFQNTITIGDVKMMEEGFAVVDRVLSRQNDVGAIVKETKEK